MNKHQEEIDKLAIEILALSYMLHAKTEYCVFIDFMGHVDQLKIDIRKNSKEYDTNVAATEFYVKPQSYLDTQREFDYRLESVKEKRDTLKQMVIDCEIDTGSMEEIVHETYSYSF